MAASPDANVLEISDATFESEVLKSPLPFLLDLAAEWCGPCKALAPVVSGLAQDYAGKVRFGSLDIDGNPGVPTRYQVRSIPTLILFHQGEVVGQLIGAQPRQRLVALLEKAITA
ncbi:MAG: thioredoxin [Proteobacteria bacterium]|nr:thioredoxin [Pseudomonadota bacterium]